MKRKIAILRHLQDQIAAVVSSVAKDVLNVVSIGAATAVAGCSRGTKVGSERDFFLLMRWWSLARSVTTDDDECSFLHHAHKDKDRLRQ